MTSYFVIPVVQLAWLNVFLSLVFSLDKAGRSGWEPICLVQHPPSRRRLWWCPLLSAWGLPLPRAAPCTRRPSKVRDSSIQHRAEWFVCSHGTMFWKKSGVVFPYYVLLPFPLYLFTLISLNTTELRLTRLFHLPQWRPLQRAPCTRPQRRSSLQLQQSRLTRTGPMSLWSVLWGPRPAPRVTSTPPTW